MTPPNYLERPAFAGSFFTTTEYEEVWGEDWDSLFHPDLFDPCYPSTLVLAKTA